MDNTMHTHGELRHFRDEVREFLSVHVPSDIRDAVRASCLVTRDQAQRWQRVLHAKGWAAPSWPREHGGPGWSLVQQAIFREELANVDAPRFENLGIDLIGPTLMRYGTPVQCARYLPRILSFDDFWAQGYSEPGAGSDLASLRCTAKRVRGDVDDEYVIDGTKIWQSFAHWSNWLFMLVRTDASAQRRQDGLSVLLVELDSPGLTVRPIRFINGSVFHSQLFFDGVRVPATHLVGAEGMGWQIARSLLVHERLFIARVAECRAESRRLEEQVGALVSLPAAADLMGRHAELDIRGRALECAWWPAVRALQAGSDRMLEAALLKLQGTELLQDIHQLKLDVAGAAALPFNPHAVDGAPSPCPFSPGEPENLPLHFFRYRGITLGGGSSEVQRDIIAKAILRGDSFIHRPDTTSTAPEDLLLDETVRRFLGKRYGFDERRRIEREHDGFDSRIWSGLAELGLAGLLLPVDLGGFGGSLDAAGLVLRACGEALLLEPYLAHAIVGTNLLLGLPDTACRSRLLADAALGKVRVALAWRDGQEGVPVRAQRRGSGWHLSGRRRFVMGGSSATHIVVTARDECGYAALFLLDRTMVPMRAYQTHDGRPASDIEVDLEVGSDGRVAEGTPAASLIGEAAALETFGLCAEAVGALRRGMALTIEYLGAREQFGRPLSHNQALQHRLVDHYAGWTRCDTLVREVAAGWLGVETAERTRRLAAAVWELGTSGRRIALDLVQMHGAIGLQDETPISHYCKRVIMTGLLIGHPGAAIQQFIHA